MTFYISNAFSLNMLPKNKMPSGKSCQITFQTLTLEDVQAHLESKYISIVGHENTALLLTKLTGHPIPFNRQSLTLKFPKDRLIVAQYAGPRLEEDAMALPKGASIKWWLVEGVPAQVADPA